MTQNSYDLSNVIFFPEPTVEEIAEQITKVEDLLEETQINYRLNGDPESYVRVGVLTDRIDALYTQMVHKTSDQLKAVILHNG